MNDQKPLEFHGTAGGYFAVFLVSAIASYIPFFGWAFALNYTAEWVAGNMLVQGKKVKYEASYGESLKFVFVNTLLLIITLGIYIFWFTPKMYRYVVDHISDAGEAAVPTSAPESTPAS